MIKLSIQQQISQMSEGEVRYVETSREKYQQTMRAWNPPVTRRRPEIRDFVMECSLYQAVAIGQLLPVVVLVRVERVL